MIISSTRRRFLAGAAVVGSTAALAACGQKSSEEQAKDAQSANASAAAAQDLPGTAWERADYEKVKEGGTLTLAVSQLPDNWNSSQTDGNLGDLTNILAPTGAPVIADEKGVMTANPDYVSAEVTSESPMIIGLKFNPKAVWTDGSPVVIADLIASAKALSGQDEAYQVVSTQGWDQIKEVRQTTDEYTGEIEFTDPYVNWISLIYPPLPAKIASSAEEFNTGYVSTPVPTYGPYVVENVDTTGGVVTLGHSPNWWGRAPKLEKIIFKVVDQSTQPQAFANGEIDALSIATGDVLGQAKTRSDAAIQTSNGLTWTHLTINTQGADGALGDIKVREAMARGIDREAVGRAVVGPLEAPIVVLNNFIYVPGQEGYEDSYGSDGLTFDQDAAKKLLDDAGWKLNGEVREKDGKQLTFSIVIPADAKSNSDRSRQIQTNLNQIGFKVELQSVPSDAYFRDYITPKNFDAATYSWIGTAQPESGINIFTPVDSEQNKTNYSDPKLADLAKTALSTLDDAERIKTLNEFSQVVATEYTLIPFYVTPEVWGVKKGVVNYGATQFETADWTAVGFTA